LRVTGCDALGAPYVIRGLLRNLDQRFKGDSSKPAALAKDFLDEAKCPAARSLSEEDRVKLFEMRDRAVSPPKQ
jgi:hypothetical protein